jgi:oxygen-independent coproporphyrinogen-3 oxidase
LLPNKIPLSLYVHLPWCEARCPYCDFSITTEPVNGNDTKLAEAIIKDINRSKDLVDGRKFKTIYFGGGTPSLASTESIKHILDSIKDRFLSKETEITLEMNPSNVSGDRIDKLLMAGINRISLGVQSYNNQELQALGRNHDRESAIQATQALSGINSTIDLIYGIEKQTPDSFAESLEKITQSGVNHLSLYQLIIEPNTIFYKKELKLPCEEEIEKIEFIAKDLLEKNGYKQYEVSSWSKPGHESQHNMNYWQFGDFLGVGPGSHSKISNEKEIIRFRKIKPLEGYIQNQRSTDLKIISDNDLDMDLAMNLLRIKNGLLQQDITIKLPASFLKKYQRGIDEGLLLKDRIGATQKGYRFLNETIQLFF